MQYQGQTGVFVLNAVIQWKKVWNEMPIGRKMLKGGNVKGKKVKGET